MYLIKFLLRWLQINSGEWRGLIVRHGPNGRQQLKSCVVGRFEAPFCVGVESHWSMTLLCREDKDPHAIKTVAQPDSTFLPPHVAAPTSTPTVHIFFRNRAKAHFYSRIVFAFYLVNYICTRGESRQLRMKWRRRVMITRDEKPESVGDIYDSRFHEFAPSTPFDQLFVQIFATSSPGYLVIGAYCNRGYRRGFNYAPHSRGRLARRTIKNFSGNLYYRQ